MDCECHLILNMKASLRSAILPHSSKTHTHTHRFEWALWSRRAWRWWTCLWSWPTARPHCWSCASVSPPCDRRGDCARTAGTGTSWPPPYACCHPTELIKIKLKNLIKLTVIHHFIYRGQNQQKWKINTEWTVEFWSNACMCLFCKSKTLNLISNQLH